MFNFIVELVRTAMNTPHFNLRKNRSEQQHWKTAEEFDGANTSFSPTSIARICSASDLATISESRQVNSDANRYKQRYIGS